MKYLNIDLALVRSAEFLSASHEQRATWFILLCHCADQNNGGMIRDAAKWHSRQWGQLGLTTEDVSAESPLWTISCGHLTVFGYPKDQEFAYKRMSKGGSAGNLKRWSNKVVEAPIRYKAGSE